jgi:hypothetical protein
VGSDVNHSCSSLCSVETSSTEHFLAATLATLSSSRRASTRVLRCPPSFITRSAFLEKASLINSSSQPEPGTNRGVEYPEDVKSVRINRTDSVVNCSRQNGQTVWSREGVFSTIFLQQLRQRTWPQGMLWGRQRGPYSSAHTSQDEPGLSESIVLARKTAFVEGGNKSQPILYYNS